MFQYIFKKKHLTHDILCIFILFSATESEPWRLLHDIRPVNTGGAA